MKRESPIEHAPALNSLTIGSIQGIGKGAEMNHIIFAPNRDLTAIER